MTDAALMDKALASRKNNKALAGARLQRLAVLVPYLWLTAFFLLPFAIVLKLSLSESAIAQPPYVPVFDLSEGFEGLKGFFAALSFRSYELIASDWIYAASYVRSLEVATLATA